MTHLKDMPLSPRKKHVDSQAAILLVDDQPANLLALEVILEELGHSLFKASSGEEALRLVQDHDFAVVLLDVQMRGLRAGSVSDGDGVRAGNVSDRIRTRRSRFQRVQTLCRASDDFRAVT